MTTTSKATHTAGPWRVGPYYKHEVVSDSGVICCAPIETGQARIDARLIAAAPEMGDLLEALQHHCGLSPTWVREIQDVLVKAGLI